MLDVAKVGLHDNLSAPRLLLGFLSHRLFVYICLLGVTISDVNVPHAGLGFRLRLEVHSVQSPQAV